MDKSVFAVGRVERKGVRHFIVDGEIQLLARVCAPVDLRTGDSAECKSADGGADRVVEALVGEAGVTWVDRGTAVELGAFYRALASEVVDVSAAGMVSR